MIQYLSEATKDRADVYDWMQDEDIGIVDTETGICYVGSCYEGYLAMLDEVESFLG